MYIERATKMENQNETEPTPTKFFTNSTHIPQRMHFLCANGLLPRLASIACVPCCSSCTLLCSKCSYILVLVIFQLTVHSSFSIGTSFPLLYKEQLGSYWQSVAGKYKTLAVWLLMPCQQSTKHFHFHSNRTILLFT